MKTLLSAALAALALSFTLPALADGDRGYDSYYDRSNWHVPRYNFRQSAPRYDGPWIHPGVPRYYHGYDYRRHDYRGPHYRGPHYSPGYRGHDRHRMHHHYRGSNYPSAFGDLYLLNEIFHHDQHHSPRR
ncbi:MAG: hypothetical protein M0R02_16795 [Bacteroidales bacterium]|nr:hypothetical protein [Bacteroidales bacterium]